MGAAALRTWQEYISMIMRAAGKLGDDRQVLDLYKRWQSHHVNWENKYLAGIAAFNLKRYRQAASYWGDIPELSYAPDMQYVALLADRGTVPPFRLEYEVITAQHLEEILTCLKEDNLPVVVLEGGMARMSLLLTVVHEKKDESRVAAIVEMVVVNGGEWGKKFGREVLEATVFSVPVKLSAALGLVKAGVFQENEDIPILLEGKRQLVRISKKISPALDAEKESGRQKFAKTSWGSAWLKALREFDHSNRLPRGRSYAKGGRVTDVKIRDGILEARVKGQRTSAYRINLGLMPFTSAQVETINRAIGDNPAFAADLAVGKLPTELLSLFERQGIQLFPGSWDEVDADCSCPDWANPCKHLAAVYYVLAQEIDIDPFILFSLRGLSKEELMGAAGFAGEMEREDRFIPLTEVAPLPDEALEFSLAGLDKKAYGAMFSLLADKPLFFKGENFKRLLMKAYKNVAAALETLEVAKSSAVEKAAGIRILYHGEGQPLFAAAAFVWPEQLPSFGAEDKGAMVSVPVMENGQSRMRRFRGIKTGVPNLLKMFLEMPLLLEGSPEIKFLSAAASVALALARASAFVPEAVHLKTGHFYVAYRPLAHDADVLAVIDLLTKLMPPELIFHRKNKAVLPGRQGVEEILSLYLAHMMREYSHIESDDKLCLSFFRMADYRPERFEERKTGKAVADWMGSLSGVTGRFGPLVRIELPTGRQKKFRFFLDVEDREDPLAPPLPLAKLFAGADDFCRPAGEVLAMVARQVAAAAGYCPWLKEMLANKGEQALAMGTDEVARFLGEGKEVLAMLGIRMLLPKELRSVVAPKLVLSARSKGKNVTYLSVAEMVAFDWEVSLGELRLSGEEFKKLAMDASGIVHYRDSYLLLQPDDVERILTQLEKPLPKLGTTQLLRAGLTGEAGDVRFEHDAVLAKLLADLQTEINVPVPVGLQAKLRPYQERGLRWLYGNYDRGLGSCLADDMGLGKTVQVIALILKLKEEGKLHKPALVVCPTTLLGNWEKECARFAPSLKVAVCHGPDRELQATGTDVIITSYGVARNDKELLSKSTWGLLVIDEAQNVKNADSAQAMAVKSLRADGYVAMSGTPVENRLDELWSIFNFILPGFLGTRKEFGQRFAVPVEKYRDLERARLLRKAIAPFILRRMKSDKTVVSDLPEKIIKNEYCRLTAQQAALYHEVLEREMKRISDSDGMARRGLVFSLMTALKQICNHPVHFAKKGLPEPHHSGKAEMALALLRQIAQQNENALIFTQYKEMGELLVQMLESKLAMPVSFFHGSLQRKAREKLVEAFQHDPDSRLMVVSLKAGGTGLNLTAATHVLHYDLWWNPAVEDQATDRAYRLGQKQNVTVHRFVTLGTLEEKINTMLEAKKELADLTVSAGEMWLTEMSDSELREIFNLSI
ncbi:MAG: SNF2-related protein [Firmicutes bacterium]|nr:SNF2-related protein [Bacillota bacterium]